MRVGGREAEPGGASEVEGAEKDRRSVGVYLGERCRGKKGGTQTEMEVCKLDSMTKRHGDE